MVSTELEGPTSASQSEARRRYARLAVLLMVLTYALLGGLRTITDPDTGWQLATGRYIVQHHQIPSTDVLSYTARGNPWIYPVASQVLLYALYVIGGFAALSWLSATACAGTVGICLLGEGGIAALLLVVLAVPKIAYRTAPRADLFTTVLFAALLVVLWRHFRGRYAPLWGIPLIFLIWANTHLGFIAGVALLVAYAGLEICECAFADRRPEARARLRRALPWLAAALPATLLNPWGWGIYGAILRQERDMASQQNVIAEWRHVPLNAATLAQALHWRNPSASYFWLLALAVLAAAIAIKRKQLGAAALLLAFAYLSVRHIRFQAVFSVVAVVVAAPFLASVFAQVKQVVVETNRARRRRDSAQQKPAAPWPARHATAFASAVLALTALLSGVHSYDLVAQRAYIAGGEVNLFGTGMSTWYPEQAADFVLKEKLPGNIFHDYNLGGFLSFRLGPQYPVYIDGRAIPFGDIMGEQRSLMRQSPDSPEWQREADARGINTLIFSLARYWGLSTGALRQFCASSAWKPVYMDPVAIVMVRNRPENADILARHRVDCASVRFEPPAELLADHSIRGRAELFNYYAHAGSIFYKLARNAEAEALLAKAIQMQPEEPYLHHTLGQLYEATGRTPEAEREYRLSAKLNPTEANWYTLAMLYSNQRRYTDAAHALEQAALVSTRPSGYYSSLGGLYLSLHKPEEALRAYDAAADNADYEPPEMRASIEAAAAEGKIRAQQELRGN